MKLSQEERNQVVKLEIEKAKNFIQQADEMCRLQYWDIAANRYYYACFHAVQALLIANGYSSHTHNGLISQFGLHFVKTNIVPVKYGSFLSRMELMRKNGDYNCIITISEEELATMIEPAKELVLLIEGMVSEIQ